MNSKKCVISKVITNGQENVRYIRVDNDVYECIGEISKRTGRSYTDVANRLCRYALEDVYISEAENAKG